MPHNHPELDALQQRLRSEMGEETWARFETRDAAMEKLRAGLQQKMAMEARISKALYWFGVATILLVAIVGRFAWYLTAIGVLGWIVSVNLIMPALSRRLYHRRFLAGTRKIWAEEQSRQRYPPGTASRLKGCPPPSHRSKSPVSRKHDVPGSVQSSTAASPTMADLLKRDLGPGFPVISGEGKKDDPLVFPQGVSAPGLEHQIIRHLEGVLGEEYEIHSQRLLKIGDAMVDEVLVNVRKNGEEDWRGRRYYFDVTAAM